ncbi:TOG array regulator of axonemal microtubules protein 1 [Linum grandiflorum]
MSEAGCVDIKIVPENGSNGCSNIGDFDKTCNGNAVSNVEEHPRNTVSSKVSAVNGTSSVNSELETVSSEVTEVEYIESENLSDVEDVDVCVKDLIAGLQSKDWVMVCESLNNARRLSLFHKEKMLDMLDDVIPLLVKSLKNPRSAVCKTTIMACADIFLTYNDQIVDSLDALLLQLLLKSSQDKRFVCEAAEKALTALTTSVSPTLLLPKLQPHLYSKNPRIRAKASIYFCRSVPRLGTEGIIVYGIDKLVEVAARQLSDKLPESREAARTLLTELKTAYEKSLVPDDPESMSWEQFCSSKFPPTTTQAVLRVTGVGRGGLVQAS